MPLIRDGKPDLKKLGHDTRSSLVAIDSAFLGMVEKPENQKAHKELYALAKERAEGIVLALIKWAEESDGL
jgi:hypothetical protein